jgi:hypothetical protein
MDDHDSLAERCEAHRTQPWALANRLLQPVTSKEHDPDLPSSHGESHQ